MAILENIEGLPLYIQVRNRIKDGIESGLIQPDDRGILPGQQEFADKYNVGVMTIKRAIRDLEQMGLVESRRGKGLMLKSSSVSRENGLSHGVDRVVHVGVAFFDIFKTIGNPYVTKLLMGAETFSREHNIALHIVSFPGAETHTQEDTLFSHFPFMNLDGLLLLSPVSTVSMAKIIERQIPYVSYNLLSDESAVCHTNDPTVGPLMVTDSLLRARAKNIVLFAGNKNKLSSHMVFSGYRAALLRYGVEVDLDYVSYLDYGVEEAKAHLQRMLSEGRPIDAVIGHDDVMAAQLKDYLVSMGQDDILVGGLSYLEDFQDKIDVTCEVGLHDIGFNLLRDLSSMIDGEIPQQKKHYYKPVLIERDRILSRIKGRCS